MIEWISITDEEPPMRKPPVLVLLTNGTIRIMRCYKYNIKVVRYWARINFPKKGGKGTK